MRVIVATLLAITLTGCGGRGPIGTVGNLLFGTEQPTVVGPAPPEVDVTAPVLADGSVLVPQIVDIDPEPALRGLIIRVTGQTQTGGYFGAALVPAGRGEPDEDGIVTYAFRIFAPADPSAAPGARRVVAATFVPDTDLDEVRAFRVIAADRAVTLAR